MNLNFLPEELKPTLNNINLNFLSEIRLRQGQPVIIQYKGEYTYINSYGVANSAANAIVCKNAEKVLYAAMEKSVYAYSEQLKKGFITVDGGVRIGIAGEYVTQGGETVTVKNVTSLNIRIPHDVVGAADEIYAVINGGKLKNTLIFSPPGYGKTTLLRDLAGNISKNTELNVLVFDERCEIAGYGGKANGFDLGCRCDVICGADKVTAFANAVRVMRPQVIITDELFGQGDYDAVRYVIDCGITVIASSHTIDKKILKSLPFETFVELKGLGEKAVAYDKNFNIICHCSTVGRVGNSNIG